MSFIPIFQLITPLISVGSPSPYLWSLPSFHYNKRTSYWVTWILSICFILKRKVETQLPKNLPLNIKINPLLNFRLLFFQVLARYRLMPDCKTKGLFGAKPLVVYTSEESHYSIVKGANWYIACWVFRMAKVNLHIFGDSKSMTQLFDWHQGHLVKNNYRDGQ